MICDYHKCINSTRDEDLYIMEGLKFCYEHGTEIDKIISRTKEDNNANKELMSFWIRAYGGVVV